MLNGSQGFTTRHVLDKILYNDFERGACDDYKFKDRDVGNVLYVIVRKKTVPMLGKDWFLEYMKVKERFHIY